MSASLHTFDERNAAELVAGRLGGGTPELAAAMATIVRALHSVIREVRPTPAQWRAAIGFLTDVGHASDDRRQEWILLSDLLGVTQLVEEINGQRPRGTTPGTSRGPFYRADTPRLPLGADISRDGVGEPLSVTLHVRDLDGGPVAGAMVETWQANGQGHYENQQPDLQPEFNLRGRFVANPRGDVTYRTVRPAGYQVPDDGPVGELLGHLGCPMRRPAHLHFIVTAPGFEPVTTHVYDRSDPHIARDPLFGVKPELLGDIRCADDGHGWSLDYTFVLARARRPA